MLTSLIKLGKGADCPSLEWVACLYMEQMDQTLTKSVKSTPAHVLKMSVTPLSTSEYVKTHPRF